MSAITVTRAKLTRVRVPLRLNYVSAMGGRTEVYRVVVQLETDRGLVGIGETVGSPAIFQFAGGIARALLGQSPLDRNRLRHVLAPPIFRESEGRDGWIALGGVEMACWDLAGKLYGAPVAELLGGIGRRSIPVACCLGSVPVEGPVSREEVAAYVRDLRHVAGVVDSASKLVSRYGFQTLKLKSVGLDPAWDAAMVAALREHFGRDMRLRLDCNGAYSPAEVLSRGV